MVGRNQHHIPQFHQRGFGVRRSGKPKAIWRYVKTAPPELMAIKDAAAELDFYSGPSVDGAETLDDRITTLETSLARQAASLRELADGASVDPQVAAHIVTHLAPRTSHLRFAFARGMRVLLRSAGEIFADVDAVKRLIGFDDKGPTDTFNDLMAKALADQPDLGALDLPLPLLQQMAFRIGREQFDSAFRRHRQALQAAIATPLQGGDQAVREGHNKALSSLMDDNVRRDDLAGFEWRIAPAPAPGAILPDCIALGLDADQVAGPFMFVGREDLAGVVMPLATDRMLVGRQSAAPWPELSSFNRDAAACSHDFFLAAIDDAGLAHLARSIGERAVGEIDEAIEATLGQYRVPLVDQARAFTDESDPDQDEQQDALPASEDFQYQLSFLGCADQAQAEEIARAIRPIIGALSRVLPLQRLDGITFAADYAEGLASVDRGIAGVPSPRTVDETIGQGVAMCVAIVRDDEIKARIVLAGGIGPALIDEDHPEAAWALHVMVHELANVAMTHWFDEAFPGVLLGRAAQDYEWDLYAFTSPAVDGYFAARFSAGFAIAQETEVYRTLLIASLDHARDIILPARLAYRTHADIEALMRIAYGAAAHVVQFAAKLVGHCDGLDIAALDDEGTLRAALDNHGLSGWLKPLRDDLETVWRRRGQWTAPDELFPINRHLERVLWPLGIFSWQPEDAPARIDIPLASDAIALLQAIALGDITPPEDFNMNTVPQAVRREIGLD